jgi:hypothetical protein
MTAVNIAIAYYGCSCDWNCRLDLLVGIAVGFEIVFEHAHDHTKEKEIRFHSFFSLMSRVATKTKNKGSMDVYHR